MSKRYYLTDSLFGTPDIEISAWQYYMLVGGLWVFCFTALLAAVVIVYTGLEAI